MNDGVLHGEEVAVLGIHVLLHRPSHHAVVKDVVVAVFHAECLVLQNLSVHILLSAAETHVADDEVLRSAQVYLVVGDHDAVARCGLSGECPVGTVYAELVGKTDVAAHGEHDGERFARILLERPA